MKLLMRLILLSLSLVCSGGSAGMDDVKWDVDQDTVMSDEQPLPEPVLLIERFQLYVYMECEPDHEVLRNTGRMGIDIRTAYRTVGFDAITTDSSLTLRLRTLNRGKREDRVSLPAESFVLYVTLRSDTASYWVERTDTGFSITSRRQSNWLELGDVRTLEANVRWMQFARDATQGDVKEFVKQLRENFADIVTLVQIAPGYYPCLPAPVVQSSTIGRRLRANKTAAGYLVGFQVRGEPVDVQRVRNWVMQQQTQELGRSGKN
ncbi:MAG TPA: hypothetical protein PKW75_03280 [candidate division Zixibacteria bacterium]|nr:hypothetical protein [candidate division Zixibacteria bacterium]MDD4916760.1 hypothetical protein [candidate division Zixibacteria bacterium]MDM7973799.1 hypothetical protein [candidate division Zixibacteria bacterium]HOD65344.1 hypothetical protein [candidate division Zixibacteria bacterium]HOZ07286.1 hypothetical protein [candidate division Zixibacteria bacterium]